MAEVGKYRLSQHDIHSEIFNGKMDIYYSVAIGGIKLMVRKSEYDEAKRILASESDLAEDFFSEKDEISSGIYCFKCHSKNIKVRKINHLRANLMMKYFKMIFGYKNVYKCKNCKFIWKR